MSGRKCEKMKKATCEALFFSVSARSDVQMQLCHILTYIGDQYEASRNAEVQRVKSIFNHSLFYRPSKPTLSGESNALSTQSQKVKAKPSSQFPCV